MPFAQHLQSIISSLDALHAPDQAYREAFSTGAKRRLGKGETWRSRLVRWAQQAEGAEPQGAENGTD